MSRVNEALKKINPFGTVKTTDVEAARAYLIAAESYRKNGHAVVYDEVYDSSHRFVHANVTHYRSCAMCAKIRSKENADGKVEQVQGQAS